jgi:hypothetical protein
MNLASANQAGPAADLGHAGPALGAGKVSVVGAATGGGVATTGSTGAALAATAGLGVALEALSMAWLAGASTSVFACLGAAKLGFDGSFRLRLGADDLGLARGVGWGAAGLLAIAGAGIALSARFI